MPRASAGYRVIPHTADVAMEVHGPNLGAVFDHAARALFDLMIEGSIKDSTVRTVEVDAADRDALLVAWLNELVFLFETEHLVFSRFAIAECTESRLKAQSYGEPFDRGRHEVKLGVKAATFHGLQFEERGDGLLVRVVLDI